MAELKTFSCDAPNCPSIKKDANHWYQVIEYSRIRAYTVQEFGLTTKNTMNMSDYKVHDVCSESCLLKVGALIRSKWNSRQYDSDGVVKEHNTV